MSFHNEGNGQHEFEQGGLIIVDGVLARKAHESETVGFGAGQESHQGADVVHHAVDFNDWVHAVNLLIVNPQQSHRLGLIQQPDGILGLLWEMVDGRGSLTSVSRHGSFLYRLGDPHRLQGRLGDVKAIGRARRAVELGQDSLRW